MNVEMGAEAAQFPEKKYINGIALAVCIRFTCTIYRTCKAVLYSSSVDAFLINSFEKYPVRFFLINNISITFVPRKMEISTFVSILFYFQS
jgi:hypothetical protein